MNVTEQSFTLSRYASAEVLSARQKPHTTITVGVSSHQHASRIGRPKGDDCRPFVLRIDFHQTRNTIAWSSVQSRSLFWITRSICAMNWASITVKHDSSAPCALNCQKRPLCADRRPLRETLSRHVIDFDSPGERQNLALYYNLRYKL